jgi:ABC-type amino acid transport substrate-binding protein
VGKHRLRALACVGAVLALGVQAGCGGGAATDTTAGGGELQTIEEGKLIVGSDIPYEPFEGGDPPDYEGFDIALVNEVGDRLGLEVEIQDTPFDTIIQDLQGGKFDIVASALSITPEREQEVAFSDPYFQADQSLMVKRGSDVASTEDLEGRTIGAQKATTGADYAEDETSAGSVRTYPEINDAFNALNNEQIEAIVNDYAISKHAEQNYDDLVVVETIPTEEAYGLAAAKDSTGLLAEVNAALEEIVADGTYARIYEEWIGGEPPEEYRAD